MKKIFIFSILVIIIVIVGGLAYNYFKPNIINLENIDQSILQEKDINNPVDLKSIIEEVEDKNILPANPRIKVFYGGVEVAYIDHLGNIMGSSGWFTNLNATTTNSSVFYEGGSRVALNSSLSSYLLTTDQRFNETSKINSINTTQNIMNLGFYNKSEVDNNLSNYYLASNPSNYINTSASITQINLTSLSYTGNITNGTLTGYTASHNICHVLFGGYMCTWNEVDNFQRANNISTITGVAWVIGGPPKYAPADHPVSDCSGFTDNRTTSTSPLGNFWNFDVKYGIAGNCGLSYPLACCK